MGKKILKVLDDFYQKTMAEGDEIHLMEGKIKILDLNFKNEFGNFILCEYIDQESNEEDPKDKIVNLGHLAHSNHTFEIVGTIHVPGYRNLLAGIGFYVYHRNSKVTKGYSFQETWDIVYRYGATNAMASSSQSGIFFSKLIDSVEGLPSLDSFYWKKNAYDENGKPYAPLSKKAEIELRRGMRYAARSLINDSIRKTYSPPTNLKQIEKLATMIRDAKKITVLAGAGLSTNSGIPDYRSPSLGLWKKNPAILQDLNEETFLNDPYAFWGSFYTLLQSSLQHVTPFLNHEALVATIQAIEPNQGHRFFSWLEKDMGKDITIITQNVDGLSQKAGNIHVIEMHGNIFTCSCPSCDKSYELSQLLKEKRIPTCSCETVLRPNVVFFGDQVHDFEMAQKAVSDADLVLAVGTSLQVSPFNQLPNYLENEAKFVLINGTKTEMEDILVLRCWEIYRIFAIK
ncbi:SIR2 family NAD-dependent protein deacylase [Niallia sp. Sow4_A1]|uniref:SIR2 family NAD-dependent protein deacylase n=1 Tax=unclassified Niallia TaxID=2837522 RepID=UPI00203DF867|nr:Sir2 family NAD-dependent protein deacetylase [Niallia sp. MER TA 168]MCM3363760.1 hypothetical protein [Niallia sp. MER TA 168]